MVFPVNTAANPMAPSFNTFQGMESSCFTNIPGAFPPPIPLSMGMPGMPPPPMGFGFGPVPVPCPPNPFMGMPLPPPPPMPQQQPPQENPMKSLLMNLMKMQMIQKMLNPQPSPEEILPAPEEVVTEDVAVGDNVTALDIIGDKDNFDEISGGDGSISFLDLSRAARKSKNGEVRGAAAYILRTNPHLFDQLEKIKNEGDGKFTESDISKAMQDKSITQGGSEEDVPTEEIEDNITALDQLAAKFDELEEAGVGENGKPDGRLTFVELSRGATKSDDPQVKKLATYLRQSGLFTQLDNMDAEAGVTLDNINAAYQDDGIVQGNGPSKPKSFQRAMEIIDANIEVFTNGDPNKKTISYAELMKALSSSDPKYTPEIKAAVQHIKDNKEQFEKLDKMDGNDDDMLQRYLISDAAVYGEEIDNYGFDLTKPTQEKNKEALEVLTQVFDKFDDVSGKDGQITEQDLETILADTTGKFTSKEKAVIRYMAVSQNNRKLWGDMEANTLWELIDKNDDKVEIGDIRTGLDKSLKPDEINDDDAGFKD